MRVWYERGYRKKPPLYELTKLFTNDAFTTFAGDDMDLKTNANYDNDLELLSKFYRKYPEVKYFP